MDKKEETIGGNMGYDDLKRYNGHIYTGMTIGGEHRWVYPNGIWYEKKISPDVWDFTFRSMKKRYNPAPKGSGAKVGTEYHWYIIADQKVIKFDTDRYQTFMFGKKFKVGHKRPSWRAFSYQYPEQMSYKERVIKYLKEMISLIQSLPENEINEFLQDKKPVEDGNRIIEECLVR